jgi:hypothetical protein
LKTNLEVYKELGVALLKLVGLVTFLALQFMFYFLLAFAVVVWGFCRAAGKGHR